MRSVQRPRQSPIQLGDKEAYHVRSAGIGSDIYNCGKVGAHQVLTEREQAMYDDILEDAGYYQAFCLYTAMIDFPTFYEQSVSIEKQPVKERQKEKIQEIEKHKN